MALVNPIIWGEGSAPVETSTTSGMVFVSISAINDVKAGGTVE